MSVLLLQLDGKMPNLALMRLANHYGGDVILRKNPRWIQSELGKIEKVYASAIFVRSQPLVDAVRREWPDAVIGGTGSGSMRTLEEIGIGQAKDYSIYPDYEHSIGFTQRGCRLQCEFCVVPKKEGRVRPEHSIWEIWRGDPWPRNIVLLDNDFFGQPAWRERIREIQDGGFKVSFNQGINARLINDEAAEAIASVKYYDDDFTTRRIYTAWDNRKDEDRLFKGLNALVRYGVRPDQIMVYMLCGFWPDETHADREYRRKRLRDFGARPYPMPYVRTKEIVGFQRWIIGAYDKPDPLTGKERVSWEDWVAAGYEPRKLRDKTVHAEYAGDLFTPQKLEVSLEG